MRFAIALGLLLGTAGGHASAEVPLSPATARQQSSAVKVEHEAAIANCVRLWDRGTHMTQHQWLGACKRVQDRLLNLQIK